MKWRRIAGVLALLWLGACAEAGPARTMKGPVSLAFTSPARVTDMGWCLAHAWVGADAALPAFQGDGSLILAFGRHASAVIVVASDNVGSFVRVWDAAPEGDAKLAAAKCRAEAMTPAGP